MRNGSDASCNIVGFKGASLFWSRFLWASMLFSGSISMGAFSLSSSQKIVSIFLSYLAPLSSFTPQLFLSSSFFSNIFILSLMLGCLLRQSVWSPWSLSSSKLLLATMAGFGLVGGGIAEDVEVGLGEGLGAASGP